MERTGAAVVSVSATEVAPPAGVMAWWRRREESQNDEFRMIFLHLVLIRGHQSECTITIHRTPLLCNSRWIVVEIDAAAPCRPHLSIRGDLNLDHAERSSKDDDEQSVE